MDNKLKAALIVGVCTASLWLYFRDKKPNPAPPMKQPTYTVLGKKFIEHPPSYSIQYDLIGGVDGEIIAQCNDPKPDGTGCEKFQTNQTYTLSKDNSGRFLTEPTSSGVRLTIKTEGLWLDKNDDKSEEGNN
jgi:hypothetical protein